MAMPPDRPSGADNPFRTLRKDLVVYGVMGGLSRGAGFLLLPVLTSRLGLDEYGIVEIIVSLTSLLAIFIALNLESAVARFWSQWVSDNSERRFVSTTLCFVALWGIVIFFAFLVFSNPITNLLLGTGKPQSYVVVGAFGALLQALSTFPQIVLRMQRKVVRYNILTFIQTLTFLLTTIVLILHYDAGAFGAVAAMAVGQGVACVVGLIWISSNWQLGLEPSALKPLLQYSIPMFPAVLVGWINKQIDRFLLLSLLGLGAVALFGAAAKIVLIISALVSFFQQAWIPLALSLIDNAKLRDEFYRLALVYYATVMAALALIIVAFSKELLSLLAPEPYQAAYMVIPWLLGAQILHGSASITNLGMLITKRTFGNSVAAWTGAAVNIGLGIALIRVVGLWGAAIGTFIAELVFTSLLWRFSVQSQAVRFDRAKAVVTLTCYVSASVGILCVYEQIPNYAASLAVRSAILVLALCLLYVISGKEKWRSLGLKIQ